MGASESGGGRESASDIRAELWARIAALDVSRIAHAHGLTPAVTVTHFIERALARGQGMPPVHGWLAMLTDAVASERQDYEAADRFATACSLRLAG